MCCTVLNSCIHTCNWSIYCNYNARKCLCNHPHNHNSWESFRCDCTIKQFLMVNFRAWTHRASSVSVRFDSLESNMTLPLLLPLPLDADVFIALRLSKPLSQDLKEINIVKHSETNWYCGISRFLWLLLCCETLFALKCNVSLTANAHEVFTFQKPPGCIGTIGFYNKTGSFKKRCSLVGIRLILTSIHQDESWTAKCSTHGAKR